VLVASANYSFIALVDMAFRALQPIFLSTPVEVGGLGIDPPVIGTVMAFFGILNGVFTVFFFSRLTDYFGVKKVYLMGITAAVPCFALFPVINHLARNSIERSGGLGTDVWIAVGLQVALSVLVCLCYGTSVSKKSNRLLDLIPSLARFRRSVYLHCRSRTEQSFFGGYERIRTIVGVYRACGRSRPREFAVFSLD
jgi:MFS family permease